MLTKYLWVFLVSMVPLVELRGSIIISQGLQLPVLSSYIVAIIGNMLPVPVIYLFARKVLVWGADKPVIPFILLLIRPIFAWLRKTRLFRPLVEKLEKKAMSKSDRISRYEFWGLVLFVGIPLPGTGAWTGTLAASILDMDFKSTIIAVMLGVLLAGIIMMVLSVAGFGMFLK